MKRLLLAVGIVVPVVILTIAFSPRPRAQNRKGIVFEMAQQEKGAPVRINSVTHGPSFYMSSASVTNVSQQTIRSVTFGVLLHENGPQWAEPILASSRKIETNIDPGNTKEIDIYDAQPAAIQEKAAALKSSTVYFETGILGVQFADGGTWKYHWQTDGAFDPHHKPLSPNGSPIVARDCDKPIFASLLEKIPGISSVLAQGSPYICTASFNREFCTNFGTRCTDTACAPNRPCPVDECEFIGQ